MTVVREELHRWGVLFYVAIVMVAAALRHVRHARRRRQFWRKVEGWL